MINNEALTATNLWWTERKEKGVHHYILRILPFLFQTLDALYIETRKLPLHSKTRRFERTEDRSYTISISMALEPVEYAAIRSILSLSGDIYELLKSLSDLDKEELLELNNPVKELYDYALRDMFTHLGEALTDMVRHGISGPMKTESGISYTHSSSHDIHLVWDSNTIYFTHWKKNTRS